MNEMKRRDLLKMVGYSFITLSTPGLFSSKTLEAHSFVSQRPNVIFIITDDQRLDSFGFLNKKALTPNIDRLAKEGVYFSRAYASSSVCTPSRYTCLTGRFASRSRDPRFINGISEEGQTWVHWNTDLTYDEMNIAKVFKKAGYMTGIVGKLHGLTLPSPTEKLDSKSDPNDPETAQLLLAEQEKYGSALKKHGFDYAASLHRGNLGSVKHLPDMLRKHNPEWTIQGAFDFIEKNKNNPFYLYLATTLLHGPDPLKSLKSDPTITEAGILGNPPRVQSSRQSVLQRCKAAGVPESLAPATWLDDSIGALLNKLEELNIIENTIIIYFNDHAHEGGKGTLYEGGVRTPTIIYWKNKIPAQQNDELIENIDFAPTMFDACGITPPKNMKIDGMSLVPLLLGKDHQTRESIYCEIGHTRAVITKRWKYLAFRVPPSIQQPKAERMKILSEYHKKNPRQKEKGFDPEARITHIHRRPGGDGTERGQGLTFYRKHYFDQDQLYDLQNDPGEQNNLANDPNFEKNLVEMKDLLKIHLMNLPGSFGEFKKK